MTREIKFRYRILDDHTGELIKVCHSLKDIECMNLKVNDFGTILSRDQFTGLKDKNGKEIYEGDIVAYPQGLSQDCDKESVNIEVLWDEKNGMWVADFYWLARTEKNRIFDNKSVKVIGNIYENSELLEVQSR